MFTFILSLRSLSKTDIQNYDFFRGKLRVQLNIFFNEKKKPYVVAIIFRH